MSNKMFMRVEDVAEEMGVSVSYAYNVLRSKGKENSILIEWLEKNAEKYKAIQLNYSYSNSNYQTKDKSSVTEEVLITNY